VIRTKVIKAGRGGVSWSKFKLALGCKLRLKWVMEKKASTFSYSNYYAIKGIVVQKIFELYFNQRINMKKGGTTVEIFLKCVEKIIGSGYLYKQNPMYPPGKSMDTLVAEVRTQARMGFLTMQERGLISKPIISETAQKGIFRNFMMYGMIDFLHQGKKYAQLYDGKGSLQKNADERQLLYYALILLSQGRQVDEAGLIYWELGYEPVDVSPEAMKLFVDGDFTRGREVFRRIQQGEEKYEATSSEEECKYCQWRNTCEESYYLKKSTRETKMKETGF